MEGIDQRRVSGRHAEQIKRIEQEKNKDFVSLMEKGFFALPSFVSKSVSSLLPIQKKEYIKQQLEHRVYRLLSGDLDGDRYDSMFLQYMSAKIEWVMSSEFRRRCARFKLDDKDISILQEMVCNHLSGAQVFILPPDNFDELARIFEIVDVLNGVDRLSLVDGGQVTTEAFFRRKSKSTNFPDLQNSIFFKSDKDGNVSRDTISHELGHVGFRAMESFPKGELFDLPEPKKNSPDPEYINRWAETDTRVRAMFNDLHDVFDPQTQTFGIEQLNILKEKFKSGKLNQDTVDLLEHYSDEDIIELANTAPAI